MPNWVYNSVSISGDQDKLDAFVAKATAPHPETFDEATGKVVYTDKPEFSFWNFVAPPEEAVKSGEYFGTRGFIDGEKKGDSPNNWYSWNNREWGTKWDACHLDPHEIEVEGDNASKSYSFETAWGIPEPVFEAMVKQHPELNFDFECEEEQGWGAEYRGEEGEISMVKQWDIPDSHADYVERDREHSCNCAWGENTEDWYADCPLPEGGTAGEEAQIIYQ
jgi:hypothetical protein